MENIDLGAVRFYVWIVFMLLSIIISATTSWVTVRLTIKYQGEKIKGLSDDLNKAQDRIKAYLFQADGTTIYVPRTDCDKKQGDCHVNVAKDIKTVCRKVDRVETMIVSGEKKRDQAKEENADEIKSILKAISNLTGRFDTIEKNFNNLLKSHIK